MWSTVSVDLEHETPQFMVHTMCQFILQLLTHCTHCTIHALLFLLCPITNKKRDDGLLLLTRVDKPVDFV